MRPYATIAVITLMLALFAQTGCTEQSSAPNSSPPDFPPISGTVVDAVTGEPIEGAAVVSTWVFSAGVGSGRYEGMNETLTNNMGVFNINGVQSGGTNHYFAIYKYGYKVWTIKGAFINEPMLGGEHPPFEWKSGQTYRLEKFPEGWSHENHVSFISHSLGFVYSPLWYKAANEELREADKEWDKRDEEKKKMRMINADKK